MDKRCTKCFSLKQTEAFNKNKSRKDGLQNICRECSNARSKQYYSQNRDKHLKVIAARRRKVKQETYVFIVDYLKAHPCVDCGETDIVVLQFDHQNNKVINISAAIRQKWSINSIKREIAKCEVRCANDHTRRTARQFNWYKSNGS